MNYVLHLLTYAGIYSIVALSLNLAVGYCGLLTLAHAGYYAIGAYAYALLTLKLGLSFIPAAIIGALIAAILSLAISLPSWRLRGDFFVLVSLAVQALLYSVIHNWASDAAPLGSLANLTNGPFGIPGIPKPSIFGLTASTPLALTTLVLVIALLVALVCWRLQASPWGRLLHAIRDDELAARGLGKNVRMVKLQALAISCALVALAGALYAAHVNYIDPSSATLDESILMLSMVMVGGLGNFRGPLVGAALLVLLPEALRFLHIPDSIAANTRLLFYGVSLVLLMHLRPQGLAGRYRFQ